MKYVLKITTCGCPDKLPVSSVGGAGGAILGFETLSCDPSSNYSNAKQLLPLSFCPVDVDPERCLAWMLLLFFLTPLSSSSPSPNTPLQILKTKAQSQALIAFGTTY